MKILSNLIDLSPIEVKIYNYIVINAPDVVKMSIQKLAQETYTSTATVLRFCKKYGCSGFAEFKYVLKEELNISKDNPNLFFGNNSNDVLDFFQKQIFNDDFKKSIFEAAKLLSTKSLLIFVGMGNSNILCEYACLYFSYLFNLSFRIEDIVNYPFDYFPKELINNTCIVALSISGETRELLNYVTGYSKANCSLISITANANSTLANLSDVAITYTLPSIVNNNNNLTSQVPCMYIIERLATEVNNIRNGNYNAQNS